ncbi:Aste57867_13748 [Aphanomyces stellatus]|uniref:Aste57867_13748 protein n=1 Tax=Aphanomyces stellatus TaxID=120398 RepID=A0A485KZH1_9STRA|nr:hypothetical protein As57867_013698 [Aphanomyces stellatus]VFT90581.1 Aste57867_13748 [Aphanomyces stellatus]
MERCSLEELAFDAVMPLSSSFKQVHQPSYLGDNNNHHTMRRSEPAIAAAADCVSVETFVALQSVLSSKSKEILWKNVLLAKLEVTLRHAEERADANQVELDQVFLEHTKQTLLLETLDGKLKAAADAHATTKAHLADAHLQRSSLLDRCTALTRELALQQMLGEQRQAECDEWKARCARHDAERDVFMLAAQTHRQETLEWQAKVDKLQLACNRLEKGTATNQVACHTSTSSHSTTQTTQTDTIQDHEATLRHMHVARQQDLLTIAGLEADMEAMRAAAAKTEAAMDELRAKATQWKGFVIMVARASRGCRDAVRQATAERDELAQTKRSYAAELKHVATQMKQLQETLVAANQQLEDDQAQLAEAKKRERALGRAIRLREGRAHELVLSLQTTRAKLEKIELQYTKTKSQSKQWAAQSSHLQAALHREKAEREQSLVEIDEFRAALIACCESAVALQDIASTPSLWSIEHLRAVTGIAEPLVFG